MPRRGLDQTTANTFNIDRHPVGELLARGEWMTVDESITCDDWVTRDDSTALDDWTQMMTGKRVMIGRYAMNHMHAKIW